MSTTPIELFAFFVTTDATINDIANSIQAGEGMKVLNAGGQEIAAVTSVAVAVESIASVMGPLAIGVNFGAG